MRKRLLTGCFSTLGYLSKNLMQVDFPEPMFPSMDTLNGRLASIRAAFVTLLILDIIIAELQKHNTTPPRLEKIHRIVLTSQNK